MFGRLHTHATNGFRCCILEELGIDVVFAFVMVEDNSFAAGISNYVRHLTELDPGAGIQNDVQVGILQIIGLDIGANTLDLVIRIDEMQVGRHRLATDDANLFAQRFQDARHAKAASQGVAVGPNMAGQNDIVCGVDDFAETGPVDIHVFSSFESW
jgi:hypothetical protein